MKHATFKRVLREVKEANNDFFNLRTVISPDTVGDDDTRFFFMMLPNDGAMAHQTLVGTFYIPEVSFQRASEALSRRYRKNCCREELYGYISP
jgi:hypothetical protein